MARRAAAAKPAPAKDPNLNGGSFGSVPIFDPNMRFSDIGSGGLRAFSGWVREEFLPKLIGRQGATVYREMLDNSPIVGAVLFAIMGVMRKVEWRVEPADDTPAAREAADFAESLQFDMSHTWEDFVVEALSMLTYGYAPHEIVYKRRLGPQPFGSKIPSSEYDDGLIGWHRLPLRGQDTVLKWFFGPNGEVLGLTQQPWIGPLIDLPMEKMLLFRPTQHKNNPEGKSILRSAYRPYFFVKRLEEQEAILFERMSGLPTIKVPNTLLDAAAAGDANANMMLTAYKNLVANVRIDEQMGLLLPSDTWKDANGDPTAIPMYDFKLETPNSGRSNLDGDTPIKRHKVDIMTSVLCDFLEMGHTSRGAQNLADTKVDLFMQAVEGWLNSVAAVINRYAVPRIWGLNGFDRKLKPEFVPDLAQRIDLDGFSNAILRYSQAGMPLFPDPDLESFVRETTGMPDAPEGDAYLALTSAQSGVDPQGVDSSVDSSEPARPLSKRMRMEAVVKARFLANIHKRGRRATGAPLTLGKPIDV
jgi:hypothetical protein